MLPNQFCVRPYPLFQFGRLQTQYIQQKTKKEKRRIPTNHDYINTIHHSSTKNNTKLGQLKVLVIVKMLEVDQFDLVLLVSIHPNPAVSTAEHNTANQHA
jgi:hypothetical protein